MNWGVIIANVIAVLALVVAVVGVRTTDARAKTAEEGAHAADAKAAEAVAAAERSASATERIAEAMERQSIQVERQAVTPGVAWTLEHNQEDSYLLSNVGRGTAYEVRVEADKSMFLRDPPNGINLGPGEAVKFLAGLSLGTSVDTVTVTWSAAPSGDRLTWRRPVPPRTSRGGWVASV